jgi:phage terminase small subunit
MALTAKQRAFVREYVKDFNATKAAERAGYSDGNYGRQLLTNPNVAAELANLGNEARTDAVLTLSELQQWWSNLVRAYDDGLDVKDALKASEFLSKSIGGFTDKVEQSGVTTIRVVYDD